MSDCLNCQADAQHHSACKYFSTRLALSTQAMAALRLLVGPLLRSLPSRMASTCPLPAATDIAELCEEGRLNEAVNMLHSIHGIAPSSTYVCLLRCCTEKKALEEGKRIHALMRNQPGLGEHVLLHNTLLRMYAICDSLDDARGVFDRMIERDVFTWSHMITAYRKQGFCEEVLALFHELQRNGSGVQPDEFIFSSVVPACGSSASMQEGVEVHRKIIRSGFHSNVFVTNALIDMYGEFGEIQKARVLFDKMKGRDTISWTAMITGYAQNGFHEEARALFDKMKNRNTISWSAMIAGYAQNGLHEKALEVFEEMQRNGVVPDEVTFAGVVPAYASSGSLEEGVDVHRKIIRSGFHSNVVVGSALIDLYAKFGNIQKARALFDKMKDKNTISWNAMITGYAQNGLHEKALEVFEEMQRNDVVPTEVTFVCVVPTYASSGFLEEGVEIHRKIIRSGFHSDIVVTNALIDMYAKFGKIQKARVLFDKMDRDTISWNAMITGYAQNGFHEEARALFDKMKDRDTISWSAMITGYAQNGLHEEALEVYEEMQRNDFLPNKVAFASVLSAFASSGFLEEGVDIHRKIIRSGFHLEIVVRRALIAMYAKFGMIQKTHVLYDKMEQRDTILWNSMTQSYGIQ